MINEKKPLYILAAAPHEPSKLRLFESSPSSVSDLLMRENGFRYAGWDLSTENKPKIIKGEYLEARIEGVKNINIYEDGRFVCWFAADPNFLAWPLREEEFINKPRLNPIGLLEVTYNFVDFYRKLLQFFIDKPLKIRFIIQFKNAFLDNDKHIYLIPGGLGSINWIIDRDHHSAPEENMDDKYEDVSINMILEERAHVAYLLIEKLYLWFGMDKDCIPYISKDDKGKNIIDIEKIKSKQNP